MPSKRSAPKPTPNPTRKKGRKPAAAPDWRPVFLKALAETGNVSAAARKAAIHRDTAYAARPDPLAEVADPEAIAFGKAWDAAIEVAIDALEEEARRRAVEGTLEPVGWYRGVQGGTVRRYSDTLLIVLLKAHRPEKYRELVRAEHTGAGGAPLVPIAFIEPVPPAPVAGPAGGA